MSTYPRFRIALFFLFSVVVTAKISIGQAPDIKKPSTKSIEQLDALAALGPKTGDSYYKLKKAIKKGNVSQDGVTAREVQRQVIERAIIDFQNKDLQHKMMKLRRTEPNLGATLALEIYFARLYAKSKNSIVVAGRLVVDDGKVDPRAAQGQMPVGEGGYFADAIGDTKKPIGFAMQGYSPVFAVGDNGGNQVQDNVLWLGDLHLKRDKANVKRSFHGKLRILGDIPASEVSTNIYIAPPVINVPSGSGIYRGLAQKKGERLPKISISKTGEVSASGFSPTKYWLYLTATGYATRFVDLDFSKKKEINFGGIPMLCADIGYYAKTDAPKSHPIQWEQSYDVAVKKSRNENKPLFIMFTSETCVPCKKLEVATLKNPWIEQLLQPFITVQVWEDRELEEKLTGSHVGYPTLAFMGPEGKLAHKFAGYQESMFFAQSCAKAYEKMNLPLPVSIQNLLTVFKQADKIAD